MSSFTKVYPPYGRTIAQYIARGQKPICVGVLLSARWAYFDHVPKICIKPDEWALRRYEFGFLRGMHVVAVPGDECTDEQLGELLFELGCVSPEPFWCVNADGSKIWDDESYGLAVFIHKLTQGKLDWRVAKAAERAVDTATGDASRRFLVEFERIRARSEKDAFKFHVGIEATKQRVRELFSSPYLETREPQPA